ncbi:glycosyltransferase family 1 protein [uncultured Rhodoblastus sp.]|uniref:glycosyltransferase family 4 protein n=1 Tax=uncultured Rhodoblastus sp. TaxID=543037 RepID=UPI0025DF4427|nr:glycosyltransferase family 1 protein [uncultured Rhodoblastus sp.]
MNATRRPITFDVTHLVSRLNRRATTGIDRVDLVYARHFSASAGFACGLHYGWRSPHAFDAARVRRLVERFNRKVGDAEAPAAEPVWEDLQAWIKDSATSGTTPGIRPHRGFDEGWRAYLDQCAMRVIDDFPRKAPENAIYLNVAQSGFEFHRFFEWLDRRPDIVPVFLVHDLLPLDYPEYFRAGYEDRFNRRVETIVRHAKAIITTSQSVRERIIAEYGRRRVPLPPIQVQHLPSPLGPGRTTEDDDPNLSAKPYFVMVGTIEPRKNHQMILNLWRDIGPEAPKLVLVGANGWDNEPVINALTRSPILGGCVRRVSGLSRRAMRKLVANACALILPSFAEGYGLPAIEALTLGVPTIASDIPIFRETAGDSALFISPLDGFGWKNAIEDFARPGSASRLEAVRRARAFKPPTEKPYFEAIENFLGSL